MPGEALEQTQIKEKEVLSWPPLLLIGHRGASGIQPENTIEAFREAIRAGANMVELDVWKTRDGKLAVSHKGKIKGRQINQLSLEETRRLKPDLCSLDEVVEFFKERYKGIWAGVYVEIKDHKATGEVVDTLKRHDFEKRAIVGSFSKNTVTKLAELKSEGKIKTKISWLLWGRPSPAGRIVREAKRLGVDFVHPWHPSLPPMNRALIDAVHKEGIRIISGHTEDPKRIQHLKNLGVDGICSNRPDFFQSLT